MKPTSCGEILLNKAKCPLVDEAELKTVLMDAKSAASLTVNGVWRTVRLLASSARCTLQAGRSDLALSLITTAFELCPEPFRRLASLQKEEEIMNGCALAHSMFTATEVQHGDKDVSAFLCTALMLWHSALSSTALPNINLRSFLQFSHTVGHILTMSTMDTTTLGNLSVCWLYNTLAFSHRCKNTRAVAFYLLEELCDDETSLFELKEASEWHFVCAVGRNACARAGLHGSQVLTMWNRLCVSLYTEGCGLLLAAQEDVCRHASGMIESLRSAFDGESTHYLPHFQQLPHLLPPNVRQLCDAAASRKLCVTREKFTLLRIACWLKCLSVEGKCTSSVEFPFASLSSVVAIALQHRYADIATEFLRVGLTAGSRGDSLVSWGKELQFLIDRALWTVKDSERGIDSVRRGRSNPHQHASEPRPLLHEVMQEQSATDLLQVLVSSETLEELLPVGLAMIRGDGVIGRRLLGDKIVPSLLLDGLTRLVLCLVDEGDLPLARCFLPLVAGICERMPSQANLLATLHAMAAFLQCCPQNIIVNNNNNNDGNNGNNNVVNGHQRGLATAFSPLIPPRCPNATPPYWQTKAAVAGRTFTSRRRVFELPHGSSQSTVNTVWYCQLQVLLTRDYEGVRLSRSSSSSSSSNIEGTPQWEKMLPVGKKLLDMAARMREIEVENQQHLGDCAMETPRGNRPDEWWEKRRTLDRALQAVVETMQSDEVFGCWRVAMCGDLPPDCMTELKRLASKLLKELGAPTCHTTDLTLLLAGLPFLGARYSVGDKLLFSPSHRDAGIMCTTCKEVLFEVSEALESELLKQGIAKPSSNAFDTFCVACQGALSVLWGVAVEGREEGSEHRDLFGSLRAPVYLVLDNELHCLPFEGMDVLRNSSVARVPTATFVSSGSIQLTSLDDGLAYCVIDPGGVMPKTLKRLLPVCQRNGWKVSTENKPPGALLREIYSSRAQLYVYVGHGRGERLLHREELYERFPDTERFPAVFLMGCSSAYMDSGSSYDCYGMPYAFLHAGCPLFLGCLWHVTDGEIDRLTKRLLLLISGRRDDNVNGCLRPPKTVGEALVLARRACRLPFLTGCAAVLYGMNLPFSR